MAKIKEYFDPENFVFKTRGIYRICWAKNFYYLGIISAIINWGEVHWLSYFFFIASSYLYGTSVVASLKK
tara:strand:- start:252 stop:461 length:210 start_codon:yes stop_codon:yes gene_type:complete